jgi:SAM-dependent methyltransferase
VAAGDRERWDARYRDARPGAAPAPFLAGVESLLPRVEPGRPAPRALDVATGVGRNAVWLAGRGFAVTCADVSPVGLAVARAAADAAGLSLDLLEVDLETEPFPPGPFDLIVSIDFLHRPLFEVFPAALAADGVLVFAQATRTNLTRHPRPSARFLLDDGELPTLVRGVEVVSYAEGWFDDRHEARLVARKSGA